MGRIVLRWRSLWLFVSRIEMGKIVSLELGYFSEISCVAVGGAESWSEGVVATFIPLLRRKWLSMIASASSLFLYLAVLPILPFIVLTFDEPIPLFFATISAHGNRLNRLNDPPPPPIQRNVLRRFSPARSFLFPPPLYRKIERCSVTPGDMTILSWPYVSPDFLRFWATSIKMVNDGKVAINLTPWVELKLGVILAR